MYIGHVHLCVCLSVCLSLAAFPHYCTDPDISWGMVGVPPSCAILSDLQSMRGFRCYDNVAQTGNVSECLYSLYARFSIFVPFLLSPHLPYCLYRRSINRDFQIVANV